MVIGLDLAPARSGYCNPAGGTCTIAPRRASAHPAERRADIRMQLAPRLTLDRRRRNARIVVTEQLLVGATSQLATIARAKLHGVVEEVLWIEGLLLVEVHPSSLKKWAGEVIGRTVQSKDDMVSAALTLGYQPANDDEADAALLHAVGMQRYSPDENRPGLTTTLAGLPWPDLEIAA